MQLRMRPRSCWVDRAVCREQEQDEEGRCQGHVAKMEADPRGGLSGKSGGWGGWGGW